MVVRNVLYLGLVRDKMFILIEYTKGVAQVAAVDKNENETNWFALIVLSSSSHFIEWNLLEICFHFAFHLHKPWKFGAWSLLESHFT